MCSEQDPSEIRDQFPGVITDRLDLDRIGNINFSSPNTLYNSLVRYINALMTCITRSCANTPFETIK